MDNVLYEHIKSVVPKINPLVANGIAAEHLKYAAEYVDHIWECVKPSLPAAFEYVGSRWCTPEEEYREVTRPRYGNGRGSFELAPSYLTLRRYSTTWEGEPLPDRFLYIPHALKGNLLKLRGPTYTLSPVLADIAISPTRTGIFFSLSRDRLTFERLPYSYIADGNVHNSYVVWSAVHAGAESNQKKVAIMSTKVHYLFCKYGLTETFRRFCNTPVILAKMGDTVFREIDQDKWVVCSSTGIVPKAHARRAYRQSDAVIAVPRENYNALTQLYLAGFFYVIDHFPERYQPEYMDSDRFWRILMGHVIYRNGNNEGKLATDVDTHMASLDNYVDQLVRESLRKGGIECNDNYNTYDLFAYIIANISDIVMNADLATMYDKQLFVLRYAMIKIRSQIFLMTYKLNGNSKRALTKKDVIKIMGQFLSRDLIFDLARDHGEVSIIQAPGSNMLLKHTSNIVLQADATGKKGKRKQGKGNVNDTSRILHGSIAEVGSIFNLPKADPTGRTKFSPYMATDPDGVVRRDPSKMAIINKIQAIIQR